MKPIIFLALMFFPLLALSESALKSDEDKAFLNNYRISLDISNLTYIPSENAKLLDWQLYLQNTDQEKEEFKLTLKNKFSEQTDAFDGIQVRKMDVKLQTNYETHRTWGNLGHHSQLFYERRTNGGIAVVKHNLELSPFGIKYDFFEPNSEKKLSLSYLPTYSYYAAEDKDFDAFGKITIDSFLQTSFINLIQLQYDDRWFTNFRSALDLEWRKVDDINNTSGFLDRTNTFKSTFTISYEMSDQLSFGYGHFLEKNEHRGSFQQLPTTTEDHSLFLNWQFN
jgi:hypothetical protein